MAAHNLYNETDLFNKVALGDEKAFKTIFDSYWPQVYGTSLHLTKKPELARDLSQDIFVKLWENREKLAGIANPSSYLYTLSRNLVIDTLRKKVFNASNIDFLVEYFHTENDSPQEKAEYRELDQLLKRAVDSLQGNLKEVFTLSRYEGLTHEQIAARLGISIVSSKTYIVRALRQIRIFMEEHADGHILLLLLLLLMKS